MRNRLHAMQIWGGSIGFITSRTRQAFIATCGDTKTMTAPAAQQQLHSGTSL
jgi:hypothetical protein